jgi:hypothetical protein
VGTVCVLGLLSPFFWLKKKRHALARSGRPARPSRASVLGWPCLFWLAQTAGLAGLPSLAWIGVTTCADAGWHAQAAR